MSQGFDLTVPETSHSSCGGSPNAQAMPTIQGRVETKSGQQAFYVTVLENGWPYSWKKGAVGEAQFP